MRSLAINECFAISGGESTTNENDGGKRLLASGTFLGLTGNVLGGVYGYNQGGIFGMIGGSVLGTVAFAVAVPAVLIGTGVAVGIMYQTFGVIDIEQM